MRAGNLRHRLTIQSVTEGRSASGAVTQTWGTFAVVWGSVAPVAGQEVLDNQVVQSDVTHEVRIRHISGVTPKMRISFGTRVLEIRTVSNIDERDRELVLRCEELDT